MRIFLIKREDKFFNGFEWDNGRKQAVFSPLDAEVFLTKSNLDKALWALREFQVTVKVVSFEEVR